jgi:hypothetical protein
LRCSALPPERCDATEEREEIGAPHSITFATAKLLLDRTLFFVEKQPIIPGIDTRSPHERERVQLEVLQRSNPFIPVALRG